MEVIPEMWGVVEHIRLMSGMAEIAIFTAVLYWFFTSSRVADMLEVMSERLGGWCTGGEDTATLRRLANQQRRRHHYQPDVFSKIDTSKKLRNSSLYRLKEAVVAPAPAPPPRPAVGLACARCAPDSREAWLDRRQGPGSDAVINVLDIGRQNYANGGVISRYLCDLVQCANLVDFKYPDVIDAVVKDEQFQKAIEDTVREEMSKSPEAQYPVVRKRIEGKAMNVLKSISSAMSTTVLKVVSWICHKVIRRVAGDGCGTLASAAERLRRAGAAGLPLVFVPLHRSHLDYILLTFSLYLTGVRPPLVAAGDNMRIPLFGWILRGCGAFYIRRRVDGSEYHEDPIYKSALRAYILSSLAEKNNLEFFIEGGRTRTGKPQLPKAGILSVIMDAYLDGTIEDALLVPVTMNYDKLVDGNFVREQLGMPKQMETFWSAFKGIWRMLNTNHGGTRVHFNQPISLKELATSYKKNLYLRPTQPERFNQNKDLGADIDRKVLLKHSNSSLYGAGVSAEHKMMVEAIGRHLVYDAASATAIMSTNVVSYVLLTEARRGVTLPHLRALVDARAQHLRDASRDLGYAGDIAHVTQHALEMLGRGVVRCEGGCRGGGGGEEAVVKPVLTVAGSLELAYYAGTLLTHYAPHAIVATAIESIVQSGGGDKQEIRYTDIMSASIELCDILTEEFILCPPCQRIEDLMAEVIDTLCNDEILFRINTEGAIEEERWSRRFAKTLEEDEDVVEDETKKLKYTLNLQPSAVAERRRLVLTLRPLLEAYAATCRNVCTMPYKQLVDLTLNSLTLAFTKGTMPYGEAVSSDAIKNCLRLLKNWDVVEIYSENKSRFVRIRGVYEAKRHMDMVCERILKFNMSSPLLTEV